MTRPKLDTTPTNLFYIYYQNKHDIEKYGKENPYHDVAEAETRLEAIQLAKKYVQCLGSDLMHHSWVLQVIKDNKDTCEEIFEGINSQSWHDAIEKL